MWTPRISASGRGRRELFGDLRNVATSLLPRSLPSPPVIPIAFDMETSDPDDALTLCLLATHPRVELRAIISIGADRDRFRATLLA
jgi:hypothetical protein